jgi:HK97 family phage portal protein
MVDETREKDYGITTLGELFKRGLDVDGGRTPNRPTQPFSQVDWVYICVDKIIQAATSIQMMLSTDRDEIIEAGPVYDFFFANPDMSLSSWLIPTVGHLALYRECYWVYADKAGITPGRIIVAGPDQVKPVIRQGVLMGYEMRLPGGTRIKLFVEDVHPLVGFNPDSPYSGVGPLTAGRLAISSIYQATLFNESSLANGARISTVIVYPTGQNLSSEERQSLIAQFEARHSGARNAGKTFLATGGADVKTLSQTMADLQMVDLRKLDASTVCSLFGVPPETVGLNSEAQYAHGPATQRFITETVSSLLMFIARHTDAGILQRFRFKAHEQKSVAFAESRIFCGTRLTLDKRPTYRARKLAALQGRQQAFAWFAVEDHPAVQEALRDRALKLTPLIKDGVPLNDVIDAGDLPFQKRPWGEHYWVSPGLMPAAWIMEAGPEALVEPPMPEGQEGPPAEPDADEGKGLTSPTPPHEATEKDERMRVRVWRAWVGSWTKLEREYKGAVRMLLVRQERQLVEKLRTAMEAEGKEIKAADDVVIRVVFDLRKEAGKILVINRTFFERGARLGAAQTINELQGLTGEALVAAVKPIERTGAVRRAMEMSSRRIADVPRATQDAVARTLKQGLEGGEGLNDLTQRIHDVMGGTRTRAARIARTQTAGAVSTGRQAGMRASGVEKKGWLSARDKNVRASHRQAERDYAGGIGIDEAFVVGGSRLMYPGDPAGDKAQIINCRCLQIAIAMAGKQLTPGNYDHKAFVGYDESEALFTKEA